MVLDRPRLWPSSAVGVSAMLAGSAREGLVTVVGLEPGDSAVRDGREGCDVGDELLAAAEGATVDSHDPGPDVAEYHLLTGFDDISDVVPLALHQRGAGIGGGD